MGVGGGGGGGVGVGGCYTMVKSQVQNLLRPPPKEV